MKEKIKIYFLKGVIILFFISLIISIQVSAESSLVAVSSVSDPTLKYQSIQNGTVIGGRSTGPGLPSVGWDVTANLADLSVDSAKFINQSDVPTMTWSYGCSPTSATMLFGYYDRNGYSNMYTGPVNSGVFPLTNAIWGNSSEGYGQCPLTASQEGLDNLSTRGHKDDYYYASASNVDPYYNNWAEHSPLNCIADYMGTSMYQKYGSSDGSTWFWTSDNGSPLYDYTEHD